MDFPQPIALFLALIWATVACFCAIWAWFRAAGHRNALRGRLRALEGCLDDVAQLHDSLAVVRTAVKRIESRQGRRAKAEAEPAEDELPDPRTDPEGWKHAMNLRMFQKRTGLQ